MKTTYYTLTARKVTADGSAVRKDNGEYVRQLVCVRKADRPAGEGKIIQLADWRVPEEAAQEVEDTGVKASPRARAHGLGEFLNLESFACLSVIGTMAVLILRILVF